MRALVVLALLAGCATAGKVALVAADVALLVDWRSTRIAANDGAWDRRSIRDPGVQIHETNPVLGGTPDLASIDAYMLWTLAAVNAAYPVLPRWARPIVYFGITAIEIWAVNNNAAAGVPWR